jgi:hypothetical protein
MALWNNLNGQKALDVKGPEKLFQSAHRRWGYHTQPRFSHHSTSGLRDTGANHFQMKNPEGEETACKQH